MNSQKDKSGFNAFRAEIIDRWPSTGINFSVQEDGSMKAVVLLRSRRLHVEEFTGMWRVSTRTGFTIWCITLEKALEIATRSDRLRGPRPHRR